MNEERNNPTRIFTEAEMDNILGFYHALKKVHIRLINEGYQISDGKIIPPKKPSTGRRK